MGETGKLGRQGQDTVIYAVFGGEIGGCYIGEKGEKIHREEGNLHDHLLFDEGCERPHCPFDRVFYLQATLLYPVLDFPVFESVFGCAEEGNVGDSVLVCRRVARRMQFEARWHHGDRQTTLFPSTCRLEASWC